MDELVGKGSSEEVSDFSTPESPFLLKESSFDLLETETSLKKSSWFYKSWRAVAVHSFIIIAYTTILSYGLGRVFTTVCHPQDKIYTPARNALEYQVKPIRAVPSDPTPYMGSTDLADQAWRDMMRYSSIRLDDYDLEKINRPSLRLGDGGYLGTPAVFHELHCVKMVRWGLNLERYSHMFSEEVLQNIPGHLEHCIDVLRQSVMCRGDTSLITFHWSNESLLPQTDFQTDHQCVNWEKLNEWVISRSVDVFAPNVLNHPIFGPTFPNGYPDFS